MFGEKIYIVVCHGCGHIREHKAVFMSSPMGLSHDLPNGNRMVIPAWGCAECMTTGKIRAAYDNGPTAEAQATFHAEAPLWAERIK